MCDAIGPVPEPLVDNRRQAAMAYHLWQHDSYESARAYYKGHTTDGFGSKDPKKEMLRWGPRVDYRDNNAGRTGRPSVLDPGDVHKCIHEFLHGYSVQGPDGMSYQVFYSSMNDAVITGQAPSINKIIKEERQVEVQTLWRNMKKLEPKLATNTNGRWT